MDQINILKHEKKPVPSWIIAIQKFDKILFSIESNLGLIALTCMTVVIFSGVIMRFVLKIPNMWGEEISRYMMIWGTYLGIACSCRTRSHLYVEGFVNALPKPVGKVLRVLVRLMIIATYVIFFILCLQLTINQKRLGQTSAAMLLPMWIVYIGLLIGFFCCFLTEIMLFINDFMVKEPFLDEMRKRVTE